MTVDQRGAGDRIVILHVSDTQFGQYHQFSEGHDSLAARLLQDLETLRAEVSQIDLIVLSGDIAEQGKTSEFQMALQFIDELRDQLDITPPRVIVVPGNHDVNWNLSKAYFATCAAREIEPSEPYAPKYEFYRDFCEALYGTRRDETFQVHHFPELELSVAALDSTRQETHEAHYGHCGEDQLRQIRDELREKGLRTRIAVLHHNVRRKAEADNENLRDEEQLTRILGPEVHLVLHGHTHDGRRDSLSSGEIVLSTGSAAVDKHWRPSEVPNQYQVLELSRGEIVRRARRYERDQRRWVADPRVGGEGSPGLERITFRSADSAREPAPPSAPSPAAPGAEAPVPRDALSVPAEGQEVDPNAVEHLRSSLRPDITATLPPGLSHLELLNRLGVVKEGRLTVAGALIGGLNPQSRLTHALTHCVRYFGLDKTAARDSRQVTGTLPKQVDEAFNFLLERMGRREAPSAGHVQTQVRYQYPTVCLREVLVNALVHRDYSDAQRVTHVRMYDDRIEVWSPGAWVGQALSADETPLRQLTAESVRRNPSLAHAMGSMRYFEGEGSGLPKAVGDSAAAGAPEPTARFRDGFVVVTVRPSEFDPDLVERAGELATREASGMSGLFGHKSRGFENAIYVEPSLEKMTVDKSAPVTEVSLKELAYGEIPRAAVVAEAGLGKTAMARGLVTAYGRKEQLPIVLVPASVEDSAWVSGGLTRAVRELWARDGLDASVAQVHAILAETDTLLIVDGLDVYPDNLRREVVHALCVASNAYPRLRIVVTTRPSGWSALEGAECQWTPYQLRGWSKNQFRKFARSYSTAVAPYLPPNEAGDRVVAMARDHPRVRELLSNPLTAQLALEVASSQKSRRVSYVDLVSGAYEVVSAAWDWSRGHGFKALSPREDRDMLANLALESVLQNRNGKFLPLRWISKQAAVRTRDMDEEDVEDWLTRSAVMSVSRVSNTGHLVYGFNFQIFYEYLAASAANDRWAAEPVQLANFVSSMGTRLRKNVAELTLLEADVRSPATSGLLLQILSRDPRSGTPIMALILAAVVVELVAVRHSHVPGDVMEGVSQLVDTAFGRAQGSREAEQLRVLAERMTTLAG